ncbi:MAG: zinc ABC transporter substrate-binding protein [Nitrospiraceae bacterium]|nr:zinc ABC transporter substrate-binding protein [Nitrospiraceae bacterium]MSR24898.1 zinc ABC transporter substrate-binding protein [Nitrospiraceae bacterium]
MFGRKIVFVVAVCLAFLAGSANPIFASEPLHVVVTIPVLKDFADQVGGPHVRVVSLLSGSENEHTYSPKPSDLVAVRKAHVFIEVGMGLEVWVGALVSNAGTAGLLVVTTSEGIERIADHAKTLNTQGHGDGNPHVWLDPENAKLMVGRIAKAFAKADPAHAGEYRANQDRYVHRLGALEAELAEQLERVTDRRIVVHHPAWPYFARRFGFDIAGEIITQPGAEPSARHLQALVRKIREGRIRVIVSEPQLNQKLPRILAQESGARLVVLTAMPGGVPGTGTYLDMLRYNVTELAEALESQN